VRGLLDQFGKGEQIAEHFGDEILESIRKLFVDAGMETQFDTIKREVEEMGADPRNPTLWKAALIGGSNQIDRNDFAKRLASRRIKA
jgi:hypothetical protein